MQIWRSKLEKETRPSDDARHDMFSRQEAKFTYSCHLQRPRPFTALSTIAPQHHIWHPSNDLLYKRTRQLQKSLLSYTNYRHEHATTSHRRSASSWCTSRSWVQQPDAHDGSQQWDADVPFPARFDLPSAAIPASTYHDGPCWGDAAHADRRPWTDATTCDERTRVAISFASTSSPAGSSFVYNRPNGAWRPTDADAAAACAVSATHDATARADDPADDAWYGWTWDGCAGLSSAGNCGLDASDVSDACTDDGGTGFGSSSWPSSSPPPAQWALPWGWQWSGLWLLEMGNGDEMKMGGRDTTCRSE